MISVQLTSTDVGVIFTLINAFVEFAFLTVMLTMLAIHECKVLKKGKLINIRKHCRFVRLITLFAIILFISLEITFSRTVDEEIRHVGSDGPCVRTQINIPPKIPSGNFSNAEALITYNCLNSTTDTWRVRLGNYSTESGKVECATEDVFTYRINSFITYFPLRNGTIGCVGESIEDRGRRCVTVRAEKNVVYLSAPYFEADLNESDFRRDFYGTALSFDPSQHLEDFAKSAATLGKFGVTDELNLRRLTFLHDLSTTCSLKKKEVRITLIPSIFLGIMVVLWTFSLILFGLMFVWKREVFYDVQNTWDCTTKTSYRFDSQEKGEFYIKCVEANGEKRIFVTDSREEGRLNFEED